MWMIETLLPFFSFGGFGGVVRDHNGSFVDVFARQVQHVISAYHVELMSIIATLLFVPSLPRQQIIVVSNCFLAV